MGCIYQAKNKTTGMLYIGQTKHSLEHRKKGHLALSKYDVKNCRFFHNAIRKYGLDGFEWSVLFESDREDLLILFEQVFIGLLETQSPNGYNLNSGGQLGGPGGTKKGRKYSEQGLKNIREAAVLKKGKFRHSEETRKKMSLGHKGIRPSEETRKKMSAWQKGKPCLSRRKPWSEKRRAVTVSQETRSKMSLAHKGKHYHSDEWKKTLSEKMKGNKNGLRRSNVNIIR